MEEKKMKLTKKQLRNIIREYITPPHITSLNSKSKDPQLLSDKEHQDIETYLPRFREKLLKGAARIWKMSNQWNIEGKAEKLDRIGFFWPEAPWYVLGICGTFDNEKNRQLHRYADQHLEIYQETMEIAGLIQAAWQAKMLQLYPGNETIYNLINNMRFGDQAARDNFESNPESLKEITDLLDAGEVDEAYLTWKVN